MEWYYIVIMVIGVVIASLVAIKVYIKLTTRMCTCKNKLIGKTVIITGANTGLGYETAKDLASRGARVILACRNIEKANKARDIIVKETGNNQVICKMIDFTSLISVREFAHDILKNEEKIHILVNNAGAGGLGNYKTEDGLQIGLQVNHFGPFLLTNLLLDRLKESAPSRIIMVAAWGHKMARVDFDDFNMERRWRDTLVYCNSKLGNVITATELTRRLEGTRVTANSLHPGIVLTEIFRNMPSLLRIPIVGIIKLFLKSSYEGAQTIIHLAVAPELENVSGKYFVDCKESTMSPLAQDPEYCKKFWDLSAQYVKL